MKTLSLLLALTSLSVGATNVTLNIEGNIYDTTCQVDSASQNMVVDLGQAVASDFKDIGDTGPWKNFDLKLTNCPPTLTVATISVDGPRDTDHPFKFANSGTAKGVALELADRLDYIVLAPEARFSVVIDAGTHTADFPMAARYYATALPVTAGTFNSVVQATFTYQ
ncbi:TPA: type 1 fimbrial protein [Enterobacter cloacae]|uniref:fimbrial protein n=1 Tax=Enterobacter cloacae TaxID=550 RepID=UPI0011E6208D|nr:fimbrial protein [Enterobacter cloacae]MBY5116819.1 type 1 fimbrial protein [Enterobacter cloacae]MCK7174196.1 type 1 fimbrial protein [Enterobacter cloacae]TYR24009.1 type 1 fimbrial protein [Enterobacter cloacae]HAS1170779.1 type 1 fimbrial protein [Enterobacter cloacae]HCR1076124.1 type 1 fimbrial protein [Enterobacter cloacae]